MTNVKTPPQALLTGLTSLTNSQINPAESFWIFCFASKESIQLILNNLSLTVGFELLSAFSFPPKTKMKLGPCFSFNFKKKKLSRLLFPFLFENFKKLAIAKLANLCYKAYLIFEEE